MFTAEEIAEHRADAESDMVDSFTVTKPDPDGGYDVDDDGMRVAKYIDDEPVKGKTQAQSRSGGDAAVRTVTVGNSRLEVLESGLHIPIGAPLPQPGWRYRCTDVGPGSDLAGVGRVYQVVDVPVKTFATARRLDVVLINPREA